MSKLRGVQRPSYTGPDFLDTRAICAIASTNEEDQYKCLGITPPGGPASGCQFATPRVAAV